MTRNCLFLSQHTPPNVLLASRFPTADPRRSYFRTGLYKAALPLITGKEAAGTVCSGSSTSPAFRPGERVAYLHDGTYAAYTAVPAAKLVRIPDAVSTATAAASLMQGLTALTLIREAAGLHPTAHLGVGQGPWTLVHAAAGGTGSLLVQMLAVLGAKVIAAAGGEAKCEAARRAGAGWVVDSHGDDVVAKVKEITGGHGVDVVFDGVGKATFEGDLEMIARKGQLVMFGNAVSWAEPTFPLLLFLFLLLLLHYLILSPHTSGAYIFLYLLRCRPAIAYPSER